MTALLSRDTGLRGAAAFLPSASISLAIVTAFGMTSAVNTNKAVLAMTAAAAVAGVLRVGDQRGEADGTALVDSETDDLADTLFERAVLDIRRGAYDTSTHTLETLAGHGHPGAMYVLGLLFTLSDEPDCNDRALELFTELSSCPIVAVRAGLGRALLLAAADSDTNRLKHRLGALTQRRVTDVAERHARDVAEQVLRGSPLREARTRMHREVWNVVDLARRNVLTGRHRPDDALVRQEAQRILACALALRPVSDGHRLELLLRADVKRRRTPERRRWKHGPGTTVRSYFRAAPVLDTEYTVDLWTQRFARRGLRGNCVGLLSLSATLAAAVGIALSMWVPAGALLLVGALLDVIDGPLAQQTSRRADKALFTDYAFDRIGDVGLGAAFFYQFSSQESQAWTWLAFTFTVACLFVSYARAEGRGYGLDTSGGLFERKHRLGVLILGLLFHRPVYALLVATALTIGTSFQRLGWAVRGRRDQSDIDTHRFRLRVAQLDDHVPEVRSS